MHGLSDISIRRVIWLERLSWLPLAAVTTVIAMSLLGMDLVPGAGAATAVGDQDVTVIGNVDKEIHLDASGCTGAAVLDLGTIVPDDPAKQTTTNCVVLFGTNNSALGADLNMLEDPAAPVAPPDAMKCLGGSCGADSLSDYQGAGMPPTPGSAFSIRLVSVAGAAAPAAGWSTSVDLTGDMHQVAGATTACQTGSNLDGSCAFRFAAMASSASDQPGNYQALVQFIALAR